MKNADEHPALYLTPRKELMAEVAEKAHEHDVDYMHLPVFAEWAPTDAAVSQAVALLREEGRDLLRDPEAFLERIDAPLRREGDDDGGCGDCGEAFDTLAAARLHDCPDEDETHLPRDSCPTVNGVHGDEWALVVHAAKELGHSPRDIHVLAETLFGEDLPCQQDGSCAYSSAWERATDPEVPLDLLIGHYVHGHVEGARSYYYQESDRTQVDPRVVAIDEFPGMAYSQQFGEEILDIAAFS